MSHEDNGFCHTSRTSTKQNKIPLLEAAPLLLKHEKEFITIIFEILFVLRVSETFFVDCQIVQ